ncbi:receptor-like protein 7 [Punica granatum]|uniref:Uncharacterized protein n=2 Tax=Punica granatum TaxID=22663 RepID=A0A2I0HV28_PUNGR|nr:receptor-like protein 7 [Punica granatum]PKI35552.1 hypothetical protein CRG98_044006 [Punica granatum]
MEFILYLPVLIHIVCLTSNFHLTASDSFSGSITPQCHGDDMSMLLEFQNSFTIASSNPLAPSIPFPRPKVGSWKFDPDNQTSSNCCSWDGIECDEGTGRVMALDLSSSNLFGSINSSSSLFRLVHLQRLNLAFNHFNHSRIPSGFQFLSGLTHLNLSQSFFSGQVPPDIFTLTGMISLDFSGDLLELRSPGLASLAQNSTNLQFLNLDGVDILSPVPETLARLSSLRSLSLSGCRVQGVFPESIFQLPNLENLMLNHNVNLTVHLPAFNSISPLKTLGLLDTRLSGELPNSISNLKSLQGLELDSDNCNLTGSLPDSIENLRSLKSLIIRGCGLSGSIPSSFGSLTQLTYLDLSSNAFSLQNLSSLSWLWKLTNLQTLSLRETSLQGEIPSSIGKLSQLEILDLGDNRLSGLIPAQFLNLSQLERLLLDNNELSGHIPTWLSNMTQLTLINLQFNRLRGPVPVWITQLPNLTSLHLCFNQLNGIEDPDLSKNRSSTRDTVALPKLSSLGLASCNLREFPIFLQNHPNLELLDLNSNNFTEQVPLWMQNIGMHSLRSLNLSHNFLTGFDPSLKTLPWMNLQTFDITSNRFTGPPPRPSRFANLDTYLVPYNKLSGPFPRWICNLTSLVTLDLSFNNLRSSLPECLGNISMSLSVLNLQRNRFSGNIPQMYASGMQLKMIALGHNQLQGQLPRSLANCSMLEFIDLGNNKISDTFPSWLEPLPQLKVLILSHNKFHGVISRPGSLSGFQRLRIIDLSYNMFTGMLPEGYFQTWTSMKVVDPAAEKVTYLQARCRYGFYDFYMILINKGIHMYYPKVSQIFTAIDLSGNMFAGAIPNAIGDLQQLHLLNLSNNFLIGGIPSTIGGLSELESLDLSGNRLSGQIPWELAELNFLSFLNVSSNNLTGSIPRGPQFNTFTKSAFEGNPGLCGDIIYKKCSSPDVAESPAVEQDNSSWFWEIDWKVVLLGYGSGVAIGLVIENAFNSGKQAGLAAVIRRRLQNRQRQSRRIRRN